MWNVLKGQSAAHFRISRYLRGTALDFVLVEVEDNGQCDTCYGGSPF